MTDFISRRCLICANINPCRSHSAADQQVELSRNDAEIAEIRARQAMTDSDNQSPSKRAREALAAELSAFGYAGDMAMAATNPITSPVTPTQAALRAIDAATSTLLDEIKARVRGLRRHQKSNMPYAEGFHAAIDEALAAIDTIQGRK